MGKGRKHLMKPKLSPGLVTRLDYLSDFRECLISQQKHSRRGKLFSKGTTFPTSLNKQKSGEEECEHPGREGERSLGCVYDGVLIYLLSRPKKCSHGCYCTLVHMRHLGRKQGTYPAAKEDARVLLPMLQD